MNEWLSERTCTYHVYIIGDLDVIRNPAKYLSRLGLAFSNTEPGLTVKPQWIQREPDIKGGRDPSGKQYCFSDGIGKISVSLMTKLQVRQLVTDTNNAINNNNNTTTYKAP